jgi:hypothetical protein
VADRTDVAATVHLCWVEGDPEQGMPNHYRPCPPDLCEAEYLHNTLVEVTQELKERRACLVGARDDLHAIENAAVEDGGVWIRAVAERRAELVEAAITETDKALIALGSFNVGI